MKPIPPLKAQQTIPQIHKQMVRPMEKLITQQMGRQTALLMDKLMEQLMEKQMVKQYNHYNVKNHANNFLTKHAHYVHKYVKT